MPVPTSWGPDRNEGTAPAVLEAQRQRVLDCADEAQLQAWFDRALTASYGDEVFDRPSE